MRKLTNAERAWLKKVAAAGDQLWPRPRYDVAGRLAQAGMVEIVDAPGRVGWPWGTAWTLKLTDAGRAALSSEAPSIGSEQRDEGTLPPAEPLDHLSGEGSRESGE